MLKRVLEPEVMASWEDVLEYDAMDFTEVNNDFVRRALELAPPSGRILDCCTGTARIPILLAQQNPTFRIHAIDLSANMLKLGEAHIEDAGLSSSIRLERVDAKNLPYPDNYFDMVISNGSVHHFPDLLPFFKEINRVCSANAAIFIRDLMRPETESALAQLVTKHASDSSHRQKSLFSDSLRAAFTVDEIDLLLDKSGIRNATVAQSSDRHWTIERRWHKEMKHDFPLPKGTIE